MGIEDNHRRGERLFAPTAVLRSLENRYKYAVSPIIFLEFPQSIVKKICNFYGLNREIFIH